MNRERKVVISGIGLVTSIGSGKNIFFHELLQGKSPVVPIPSSYERNYKYKSRFYAPLPEINFSEYSLDSHFERIMQVEDKLAVICTKMAVEDAGFTLQKSDNCFSIKESYNFPIILGVGLGGLGQAFKSNMVHVLPDIQSVAETLNSKFHYSRMIIPQTMPNSVSAWVSIFFQLHGMNFTVNSACASGTAAIGETFRKIREGTHDIALTGGIEYLGDEFGSIMRGFDVLGALTKSENGQPMPFSNNRSGFLFAEGGGCVLILEEMEHLKRRNGHAYAEILDYQANSDAYNIVQMDPEGRQIRELLTNLKKDQKIDYINAHGTGTEANDGIESDAIKNVFGSLDNQPMINSTKGVIGHTIGASGAIEAAVTALSIDRSIIHGNIIPDPIPGLNLISGSRQLEIHKALSMSYGFGGMNAGLLLGKIDES